MKIHHIGIATSGIDTAADLWRDLLGLRADHTEEVAARMRRKAESALFAKSRKKRRAA